MTDPHLHAVVCKDDPSTRKTAAGRSTSSSSSPAHTSLVRTMKSSTGTAPTRLSGEIAHSTMPDLGFWRTLAFLMRVSPDEEAFVRIAKELRPGGAVVLTIRPCTEEATSVANSEGSSTGTKGGRSVFSRYAEEVAVLAGGPIAFALAAVIILAWALSELLFGLSDTWQQIINTGTTIVTFLMVLVIQNAQNRDCEAIQVTLDELVRASENVRNATIGIEKLDDAEVRALEADLENERGGSGAPPTSSRADGQ